MTTLITIVVEADAEPTECVATVASIVSYLSHVRVVKQTQTVDLVVRKVAIGSVEP